jgi:hypothetical protein
MLLKKIRFDLIGIILPGLANNTCGILFTGGKHI